MHTMKKPARSVTPEDFLVYEDTGEAAQVLYATCDEMSAYITYRNRDGVPETCEYPADEMLNVVDIEAEAEAEARGEFLAQEDVEHIRNGYGGR